MLTLGLTILIFVPALTLTLTLNPSINPYPNTNPAAGFEFKALARFNEGGIQVLCLCLCFVVVLGLGLCGCGCTCTCACVVSCVLALPCPVLSYLVLHNLVLSCFVFSCSFLSCLCQAAVPESLGEDDNEAANANIEKATLISSCLVFVWFRLVSSRLVSSYVAL